MSESFIELDRTFHELSVNGGDDDEFHFGLLGRGRGLTWSDLVASHRTVILSEAGAGKTEEVRYSTRMQRDEGKNAFFLRLEHVADDFEIAFEEGNIAEFEHWLTSDEEGWLFLDSVDEARLREPKDFERAIRKIGVRLSAVLQRTHIVLTSRGSAWRPVTDLKLCQRHLKYLPPTLPNATGDADNPFRIVALDDLGKEQIEKMARSRGISNPKPFLDAIERADAWSMAARPDDLVELIEYWQKNGRIGNRLDLMRSSIERRLVERDQDRAEASPLSFQDAISGARSVAAAATMGKESTIRVPDGSGNSKGIDVAAVLPTWDDKKRSSLLSRPIFDEAIYQTVRFHHREVREYLVAEWFKDLLDRETSRCRIESLFIRQQYGQDVIVPAMRPVLVWLILMDEKICERALALSPELILEGGEPKALPLSTRQKILREICEKMHTSIARDSTFDFRAIQRFADQDIASDVKALFAKYTANEVLQCFLLRMIWQGELADGLPEAKQVALDPKAGLHPRIAGIRAVLAVGKESDKSNIREHFLQERSTLKREWFAELLDGLPQTRRSIEWALSCLRKLEAKKRYGLEQLPDALDTFSSTLSLDLLAELIEGLAVLIAKRPVVERRYCELSQRHGWLITCAAQAVERLITARHPAALKTPVLSILQKLPSTKHYHDWSLCDIRSDLSNLVPAWADLNDALFWYEVSRARRFCQKKRAERLTEFWRVSVFGDSYWKFTAKDFERILSDVQTRPLRDDRLVALSLAFRIYAGAGRPKKWREAMKEAVAQHPTLHDALKNYLKPPPQTIEQKRWKRQEAKYKRRRRKREAANCEVEKKWKADLHGHVGQIRDHGLSDPTAITNRQYYLHERMRALDTQSSCWTYGNWEVLVPEFGKDIARAFRDGAVAYWRRYTPRLRSEGKGDNKTPISVIFGLTGLSIESRETDNWASTLSAAEAEIAFRYAMDELNGFPDWLPSLYGAFPDLISRLLLHEVDRDLRIEKAKTDSHYVLYDLSWSGSWTWQGIGQGIFERLEAREPKNLSNLGYMLNIVHGAAVSSTEIARLAQKRSADRRHAHAARWYAVWTGVEPDKAIPELAARLASIKSPARQTNFAMQFVTHLLGGRRATVNNGEAFRTAEHLKRLYALVQKYVREKDDIHRAGKGVYTPGLRDDAQDARNQLFALLKEIPGKESYLALMELTKLHPERSARPWMQHHARAKAELDADLTPWTINQTLEFQSAIERTPNCHRELFELAEMRFLDLKDNLEHGDSSIAAILIKGATQETDMRKFIGDWFRERAQGRYAIPQEEELADAKRMDLRVHGVGFDAPVPIELKLADNWTGPKLFERLENQLCGDYLRDNRSDRGLFVLVYRGEKPTWEHPGTAKAMTFTGLLGALQRHWLTISSSFPNVDDIRVIGIDLLRRTSP